MRDGDIGGRQYESNKQEKQTSATARHDRRSRAERFCYYLRVAQTYMLISMPTCTSTIFGVFQVIRLSQEMWRNRAPT